MTCLVLSTPVAALSLDAGPVQRPSKSRITLALFMDRIMGRLILTVSPTDSTYPSYHTDLYPLAVNELQTSFYR
jgi:hypothetical protein